VGNFFRVTCPYLFRLDAVAYFPVIRGRHSFHAIAQIRDTTQLFLDVYSNSHIYLHPLKVWNRYSTKMFMVHACTKEYRDFHPVTCGVELIRYYQLLEEESATTQDQNYDSYDRFFYTGKPGIPAWNFQQRYRTADFGKHNDKGSAFAEN